jgi:ribulose-phosphate 3-epimerase
MDAHIHPSILSADFANFERDFATIEGADAIHIDVMDGHFVPNLTFGLPMVRRMREITSKPLDVHLMIEKVDTLAVEYARAGAESVTFHIEASANPIQLIRDLKAVGARAAVAIKPATATSPLETLLDLADMFLVMTVEPGFGGQSFIAEMMPKVGELFEARGNRGYRIQVDGGINEGTIATSAAAGADTFVAGNCVFGASDRNEMIAKLRQIATAAIRL